MTAPTPVRPLRGTAAGVPFLAVPPERPRDGAPTVLAWHLMDAPRTEVAMAAALPLAGLDAWRVYLGLPLCGARLPEGGWDEVVQRGMRDAVLELHGPVASQAVEELPAALEALRAEVGAGTGPLAVLGGSIGSAVAQLAVVEAGLQVDAAVLVSPVTRLSAVVEAMSRHYGITYAWTDASRAVADRLDLVTRAEAFVAAGQPAVHLVVGADDDAEGFLHPAQELAAALHERYDDPARVALSVLPAMEHALAEEPGLEPAPQTAAAAAVDAVAVRFLREHLRG